MVIRCKQYSTRTRTTAHFRRCGYGYGYGCGYNYSYSFEYLYGLQPLREAGNWQRMVDMAGWTRRCHAMPCQSRRTFLVSRAPIRGPPASLPNPASDQSSRLLFAQADVPQSRQSTFRLPLASDSSWLRLVNFFTLPPTFSHTNSKHESARDRVLK